jgi:hypothetical protein
MVVSLLYRKRATQCFRLTINLGNLFFYFKGGILIALAAPALTLLKAVSRS